jgi:hypothetical protein
VTPIGFSVRSCTVLSSDYGIRGFLGSVGFPKIHRISERSCRGRVAGEGASTPGGEIDANTSNEGPARRATERAAERATRIGQCKAEQTTRIGQTARMPGRKRLSPGQLS